MALPNTDSIVGKSSADLKEMLMQTSVADSGEEKEEIKEAVTETEEVEEETKPEETEKESETEKEVESEKETEPRYKLKVEGKEEELPITKVLEYAQKGRYLEKEKQKLNAERERLKKEPEKTGTPVAQNFEQLKEWFLENANKDPVGTIFNVTDFKDKINKEGEKEERRKDREFELERADEHGELWKQLKPRFQEFRDLGYSREQADAMAQADFWKDVAANAMRIGTKKGEKKAKLKAMAEIPSGEKKGKSSATGEIPSVEQALKMPAAEIAKHLKRYKNPGW